MNLNEVTLIGRLGAKPKVIKGDDKPSFVVCKIATNEYWKHNGEIHNHTEWHTIEVNNPGLLYLYMDFFTKHCNVGDEVFVRGRLRSRDWETKEGTKRSTTVIKVDNFHLLRRKKDAEQLPNVEESAVTK